MWSARAACALSAFTAGLFAALLVSCQTGTDDTGAADPPVPAPVAPGPSTPSDSGGPAAAPVLIDVPKHSAHEGFNYQLPCRLAQGSAPITWSVDGSAAWYGMTIDSNGVLHFTTPTGLPFYPYPFTVNVKAANAAGSDEMEFRLYVEQGSNVSPDILEQSVEGTLTEGQSGMLTIKCTALDSEGDPVSVEADLSDFGPAAPVPLPYLKPAPYGNVYAWDGQVTPTRSGQLTIRLKVSDGQGYVIRYVPIMIRKPGDTTGIVATMHANPDPNDPLVCQLTNTTSGDTMAVFGQKNAQGVATRIETLEIWKPGMDTKQPGYAIRLDDDGWPTTLTAPNGDLAKLTYDGDNVTMEFYEADGSCAVATRALQPGARADTKERMAALRKQTTALKMQAADAPTTCLTILGRLALNVERDHEDLGPLLNANVQGFCAQAESVSPAFFNAQSGMYEFYVRHRVKDLHVTAGECETYATVAGGLLGVVSIGAGIVSLVAPPAAAGAALMWGAISAAASTFGIGVGIVGWKCEEMIFRAAEPGNVATVTITVNHVGFRGPRQAPPVQYNVYDLYEPIIKEGKFTTFLSISDCPAIKMNLLQAEASLANDGENRALLCEAAGYRLELCDGDCLNPEEVVPLNLEEYRAQAAADKTKYCTMGSNLAYYGEVVYSWLGKECRGNAGLLLYEDGAAEMSVTYADAESGCLRQIWYVYESRDLVLGDHKDGRFELTTSWYTEESMRATGTYDTDKAELTGTALTYEYADPNNLMSFREVSVTLQGSLRRVAWTQPVP